MWTLIILLSVALPWALETQGYAPGSNKEGLFSTTYSHGEEGPIGFDDDFKGLAQEWDRSDAETGHLVSRGSNPVHHFGKNDADFYGIKDDGLFPSGQSGYGKGRSGRNSDQLGGYGEDSMHKEDSIHGESEYGKSSGRSYTEPAKYGVGTDPEPYGYSDYGSPKDHHHDFGAKGGYVEKLEGLHSLDEGQDSSYGKRESSGDFDSYKGGYDSHKGGYGTLKGGYDSYKEEYDSPKGGYGSKKGGYDGYMGEYDSHKGGYDSHKGGYGSQKLDFDSHKSGFDSNKGAYDSYSNKGVYDSYKRGHGTHNEGYGSHTSDYDRPKGGYGSHDRGYNSPKLGYDSHKDGYDSHKRGYDSHKGEYDSHKGEHDSQWDSHNFRGSHYNKRGLRSSYKQGNTRRSEEYDHGRSHEGKRSRRSQYRSSQGYDKDYSRKYEKAPRRFHEGRGHGGSDRGYNHGHSRRNRYGRRRYDSPKYGRKMALLPEEENQELHRTPVEPEQEGHRYGNGEIRRGTGHNKAVYGGEGTFGLGPDKGMVVSHAKDGQKKRLTTFGVEYLPEKHHHHKERNPFRPHTEFGKDESVQKGYDVDNMGRTAQYGKDVAGSDPTRGFDHLHPKYF